MKRYYFDLRSGDDLAQDEEGLELPNIEAAQKEAVRSLAAMAKDEIEAFANSEQAYDLAIEVRDDANLVIRVKFTLAVQRLQ